MAIDWDSFDDEYRLQGSTYAPQRYTSIDNPNLFDDLSDVLKPSSSLSSILDRLNPNPVSSTEKALDTQIENDSKKILENGGELPDTSHQDPWYLSALQGISGIGSTITDQIANWTDGSLDWKDIPLANPVANFAKGQWNAWTDGELGFQDIPGFGGLVGMGKNNKTTTDIFDNLGWHDAPEDNNGYNFFQAKKGQFDYKDLLEFVGDVALDPTTYITLGGSSALKAGTKAGLETAEDIAEKAGIQFGKSGLYDTADNVASQILDQTLAKSAVNPTINPRLYEDLAMNKYHSTMDEILEASKVARESAQNALFNFDIPFTNITKQFGEKPDWLKITDPIIGEVQANKASQFLDDMGVDAENIPDMLKSRYGKASLDNLSTQEFDDLMNNGLGLRQVNSRPLPKDIKTVLEETVIPKMNSGKKFTLESSQSKLNKILDRTMEEGLKVDPPLQNGKHLAKWFEQNFPELGTYKDFMEIPYKELRNWAEELTPNLRLEGANNFARSIGYDLNKMLNVAENPEGFAKSLKEIVDMEKLRAAAGASPRLKKIPNHVEYATKVVEDGSDWADDVLKKPVIRQDNKERFVRDMGGTSPLGKKVSNALKAINARTFGSADDIVNASAGKILDADAKIYGNSITMEKDLKALQKAMKGLNEDEKRAIEYGLEKKLPKDITMESLVRPERSEQVKAVIEQMKDLYEKLGKADLEAGTVPSLRENYHRHALNGTDIDKEKLFEKLSRDPVISKYIGRSASNKAGIERKSFETMADLDDAISDLKQTIGLDGADSEKLDRQVQELESLFHRDPYQAMHNRYYQSIKSRAYKELHNELEKDGLIVKKGSGKPVPLDDLKNNYTKIEDAKLAGRLGLNVGDHVRNEVLKGMERTNKLFTDEGMNKILKRFDSAINVWRGLVTTNVPSHHFFNLLGNVANATIAGVTPRAYIEAGKMLMGKGNKELLEKALEHGILHQGIAQDMGRMFDKQTASKAENLVFNNPWAKLMNTAGNAGDNIARLATFIHAYEKTGSAKIAANQVRRFLFNYREMTNADKAIRIFAPFWNWTKNNLPLQISSFLQQPRYYATYKKLRDQFNGGDNENSASDWAKDDYLHVSKDGFWNPRLPLQDLKNAQPDNLGDLLSGMLTPALKVPIELRMNKQFFNGMPIDPTYNESIGYDQKARNKYLLQQTGIFGRLLSGADKPLNTILDSTFGKAQHFDPEKVRISNKYNKKDALNSTVKRMEQEGLINKKKKKKGAK